MGFYLLPALARLSVIIKLCFTLQTCCPATQGSFFNKQPTITYNYKLIWTMDIGHHYAVTINFMFCIYIYSCTLQSFTFNLVPGLYNRLQIKVVGKKQVCED